MQWLSYYTRNSDALSDKHYATIGLPYSLLKINNNIIDVIMMQYGS